MLLPLTLKTQVLRLIHPNLNVYIMHEESQIPQTAVKTLRNRIINEV